MAEKFEQIANAILNALQGKESESEKQQLKEWANSSDENWALIKQIENEDEFEREFKYFNNSNTAECEKILWQRINGVENENLEEPRRDVRIIKMPKWVAVAMVISLVLAIGYYWYRSFNKQSVTATEKKGGKDELTKATTGHDSTKILLSLADGTVCILNKEQNNKTVSEEYGIYIEDYRLLVKQTSHRKKKEKSSYHTLSIPKGELYQLTLSDGSKVWLNSGSSIVFPAEDTGKTRNLSITGEAYLEIKHDSSRPLLVNLPNAATLEVLGTAFNVNAYSDEPFIGTTLVSGVVKINIAGKVRAIKPGQQARIYDNNIKIKSNVDLSSIVAWKDGEFDFRRDTLTSVVRQLARWYKMQVRYIDTPKTLVLYSGNRSLTCDATLAGLKKGNPNIHIERVNDTLVVKQ